jgi:hypothetical protein
MKYSPVEILTRSISAARLTSCSFNPGSCNQGRNSHHQCERGQRNLAKGFIFTIGHPNFYFLHGSHCDFYSLGRGINMTRAIKTPQRESHKNFLFRAGGGRKFGAARKESQTHSPSPFLLHAVFQDALIKRPVQINLGACEFAQTLK